jgi:hypothetical protein
LAFQRAMCNGFILRRSVVCSQGVQAVMASSDSKLLNCSDCCSISFSNLLRLFVFCGLGTGTEIFWECSLWIIFPLCTP